VRHLRAAIIFIPLHDQEDDQMDRYKKPTSRIADLINLAEQSLQWEVVFFKVRNTQQGGYILPTNVFLGWPFFPSFTWLCYP
jgi:hypothetical protein